MGNKKTISYRSKLDSFVFEENGIYRVKLNDFKNQRTILIFITAEYTTSLEIPWTLKRALNPRDFSLEEISITESQFATETDDERLKEKLTRTLKKRHFGSIPIITKTVDIVDGLFTCMLCLFICKEGDAFVKVCAKGHHLHKKCIEDCFRSNPERESMAMCGCGTLINRQGIETITSLKQSLLQSCHLEKENATEQVNLENRR